MITLWIISDIQTSERNPRLSFTSNYNKIIIFNMKKMNPIAMAVVLIHSMASFYQCTHDEELFAGFPVVHDFQNLQQLHDTLTLNDTVGLSISDPTIENIIQGAQGTKLIIPANSLTLPGGGEATPPFTVSMLEIFKRGD